MPEPVFDGDDVGVGLDEMQRGGVAEGVRGDLALAQGGAAPGRQSGIAPHQMADAEAGEAVAV